jgi:hypothetical protein
VSNLREDKDKYVDSDGRERKILLTSILATKNYQFLCQVILFDEESSILSFFFFTLKILIKTYLSSRRYLESTYKNIFDLRKDKDKSVDSDGREKK